MKYNEIVIWYRDRHGCQNAISGLLPANMGLIVLYAKYRKYQHIIRMSSRS